MDPIRQTLQQLEQKAEGLQKQGKYGESLDVLEEILNLKRNAYGEDSDEYFKTSEKLCELCNLISMICLQKEKFDASLEFLKKAEILCQNSLHYKAITFNNMACYYRKTNKLRTAFQYLQKALDIEIKIKNPQSLADTHLNMCAVLSQLDKHQEALEHVLISIVHLQDEYLEIILKRQQHGNQNQMQEQDESKDAGEEQKPITQSEDRIAVLAIAYHNMGVELEYLKRFEESIQTYQKAVKFAETNLGNKHQLYENLCKVEKSAREQIENQKVKDNKRKDKGQQYNVKRLNQMNNTYKQNEAGLQQRKTKTTSNFHDRKNSNKQENFKQNKIEIQNEELIHNYDQDNLNNDQQDDDQQQE